MHVAHVLSQATQLDDALLDLVDHRPVSVCVLVVTLQHLHDRGLDVGHGLLLVLNDLFESLQTLEDGAHVCHGCEWEKQGI